MGRISEIDRFRYVWDFEARNTIRLLEALPTNQYDFRPDPKGRSLGEMAWHLSEAEAYMSQGVATGKFDFEHAPPNLQRPREVALLAPGYRRVHEEAVARLASITDDKLDEEIPFYGDSRMTVRDILWGALLFHLIHHRGQLALMCRLAGGTPPGIYGPNREEMEAIQKQATAGV